jgi:hypothetical protein
MNKIKRHKLIIQLDKVISYGRKKITYQQIKNWNNLPITIKSDLLSNLNANNLEISIDNSFKKKVLIASNNKKKNLLCLLKKNGNLRIIKILNETEYWLLKKYILKKIKQKIMGQYKCNKLINELSKKPNTRENRKLIRKLSTEFIYWGRKKSILFKTDL